ncbi:ClbS/DfsB family four-helix bundle protein [Paludibacterium paludis]|uniref:ClbS/DfsB family four-helix bundle protein n=1 Tax=Paludibacterium paludis TaxID=1225769 RepID=A0A918U857_9NEIS|nr:ClbS/DfsB family four-helix bundle protein [Paludibacterium paludis]GGY08473.1 hypothetical protein GCM10011289_09010 [Paludibacterium paludis]
MSIPASKDELLAAINGNFSKLIADLDALPHSRARDASLEGHAKGTRMSVGDLVAYLIGWNELVLKWIARDDAGESVDFPETGFAWNELGRLAQKFYTDYASLSYPQRLERLRLAKAAIVAAIEARGNEELYGRPWYGKWTMGRMIQFNTASPYANARSRLRKWLKAEGGKSAPDRVNCL